MLHKVLVFVPVSGFLLVAALLYFSYGGLAIRVTTYVYLAVLSIFLFKLFKNEE